MLSAGNQVSFSKYQKGYNKRCSIVRRPVIWGSVVLIYLPILIRMNIGIYRGKAVRNLEAVMILGAFVLFIGYLLVQTDSGVAIPTMLFSAAEMLYKQEVAERAKKNAGSTNSCSSCSTRRYDRFLRCWARSGSTSALAC